MNDIPALTDITEAIYEAAIPACCKKQTLQSHMEMMLCWGLLNSLEMGRKMDCKACEMCRFSQVKFLR